MSRRWISKDGWKHRGDIHSAEVQWKCANKHCDRWQTALGRYDLTVFGVSTLPAGPCVGGYCQACWHAKLEGGQEGWEKYRAKVRRLFDVLESS